MTLDTPTLLSPKRPASAEDLAAAVRAADEAGHHVRVHGTQSVPLIAPPSDGRPVQPVSTLKLNKVIEHAVSDMTAVVQAGMTLEALQRQLAWHNQWLPVDPPGLSDRPGHARTLGGLIATNALGPLRFGQGDWRKHILGVRWVDAAGTLIKGGGRTVKNVAGYSTPRMMIGSAGSLGAVAEITLRTAARPEDEQAVVFFCESSQQAEALLAAILVAAVEPAYVEVVGRAGFLNNNLQLPAGRMMVVAGFLESAALCDAQVSALRALPAAEIIDSIALPNAQAGRLRAWLAAEPAGQLGFRIHTLSAMVPPLVAGLEKQARQLGGKCWLVSEAATAVIRGVAMDIPDASLPAFWDALRQWTLDAGASVTVTASALAGVPPGVVHPAWTGKAMFERIKAELDPRNLFGSPLW